MVSEKRQQEWIKDLKELRSVKAENKRMRDALKKFGDHEPGCVKGDACNCGFEQALEAEK